MSVFKDYSRYYDLLYKEKDYAAEVDYINNLVKKYSTKAKKLLDLGCGTGKHASLLSQKGYYVHGIDISEDMLEIARKIENTTNLSFSLGDVCSARLNKTFDVVTSLFHVMSYHTSNCNLQKAFETAATHLEKHGIFIFDCWYGPAVLCDKPVVRVKKLEDANVEITRLAEPVMHANDNIVDVNYTVIIKNKDSRTFDELKETHRMRYLFKPEIEYFMKQVGIKLIECFEYMSGKEPGFDTWNVCFVGSKT